MITEDYVSFEVAKLLKEKGFDESIIEFYVGNEDTIKYAHNKDGFRLSELNGDFYYPHITHQMTMKWLREKHNIFIDIRRSLNTYLYGAIIRRDPSDTFSKIPEQFETYECAVEAALKYSLENLI